MLISCLSSKEMIGSWLRDQVSTKPSMSQTVRFRKARNPGLPFFKTWKWRWNSIRMISHPHGHPAQTVIHPCKAMSSIVFSQLAILVILESLRGQIMRTRILIWLNSKITTTYRWKTGIVQVSMLSLSLKTTREVQQSPIRSIPHRWITITAMTATTTQIPVAIRPAILSVLLTVSLARMLKMLQRKNLLGLVLKRCLQSSLLLCSLQLGSSHETLRKMSK